MIKDLDDFFSVLEKFDITTEQFMLPYILDQREYGEDLPRGNHAVAYIYRYSKNVRPWPRASIQGLVDKGLLKNYNEDETVYPDNLEVTDKFAEAVFAGMSDFERFWDAYLAFVENRKDPRKGENPLKALPKSKARDLFEEHVQTTREFEEVMEASTWGPAVPFSLGTPRDLSGGRVLDATPRRDEGFPRHYSSGCVVSRQAETSA